MSEDENVELFQSKRLIWTGIFATFVQDLINQGAPSSELDKRALDALDGLIAVVDKKLPEGCWWAVGSSAIWGPPGSVLPDIDSLMEELIADARANLEAQGEE
ncbi:hypothetical protein E1264_03405 [Actinomadura sp. KC216]|uniref:hypothetical protein n=1 Tax=Actinomadura sp. KC216 TaxID=2530370 RepID=UPI00104481DC|nr:hypothetical protein [Actinomadura sp. KC216]TDB90886.1 hypothetical protein E1264_03405 [Actinomadura sp. KC216]